MYLPIYFTATTMETPKGCRKPRPIAQGFQYDFELRELGYGQICTLTGPISGKIEFYVDLSGQWFCDAPLSSWHFAVEGQDKTKRFTSNPDAEYFKQEADLWENIQDKAHVVKRISDVFERYRVLPDGRLVHKCGQLTMKTSWRTTRRGEDDRGPVWEYETLEKFPVNRREGCYPITSDVQAEMQAAFRTTLPVNYAYEEEFQLEVISAERVGLEFRTWQDAALAKHEAKRIDDLMQQYSSYQHKDMAEVLSLSGYSVVKL